MTNQPKVKHCVMFTFPANKFNEYGFALKSFVQNWPKNVQGIALVEEANKICDFEQENLLILDFDECVGAEVAKFEERNQWRDIGDLSSIGNINTQAAKFSRKVFAQLFVLNNFEFDFLHYLDSDLKTLQPISMEEINHYAISDYLVSCFPRWWQKDHDFADSLGLNNLHIGYTETGYIIWNKNHPKFDQWIEYYKECYTKDYVFQFKAWHDCICFDYATIKCAKQFPNIIRDLSEGIKSEHPIVESEMGKYFDHMKGSRKFKGRSLERTKVHGEGLNKIIANFILTVWSLGRSIKSKIKKKSN